MNTIMEQNATVVSEDSFEDISDGEGFEKYKPEGFHPVYLDERFKQNTYRVLKKLGYGHFSTVWLVEKKTPEGAIQLQALKITRAKKDDYDYACHEGNLYQLIGKHFASKEWQTKLEIYEIKFNIPKSFGTGSVRMRDSFDHHGMFGKHFCFIFDVVGPNLLDLIVHYYEDLKSKISVTLVKQITRQLLVALELLHEHSEIIHTDLKLENIGIVIPHEAVHNLSI